MQQKNQKETATAKVERRDFLSEPMDEATLAIIERNASCVPFLRLPLEIKDKIWALVLGNQLIHLEYVGQKSVSGHAFRHIVCESDCPEDELIEGSTWTNSLGDVEIVWRQPHYYCDRTLAYSTGALGHESMHLKALRVCRQFYSDASYVLWTTNTFSFNDAGLTFHRFMKGRTSHQKGLLRRLRLQMDWVWGEDGPWNRALDMTLIKSLTGMRSLRLQINHSVEAGLHYQANYQATALGNELALIKSEHLELVHRMAILPLINVEVCVGDRSPPFNLDTLWTAEDRKQYADAIRRMILDPNGAAKYTKGLEDWDAYKDVLESRGVR